MIVKTGRRTPTAPVILVLAASFLPVACAKAPQHSMRDYARERVKPDTAFAYASPREVGMDQKKLDELLSEIDRQNLEMHSLSIIHKGKLVMDAYGINRARKAPFKPEDWHEIHSITKSVTSLLACIAQADGKFPDGNSLVIPWFSKDGIKNRDADKDAITLDDLFSMRSGLSWNDETDFNTLTKAPNAAKAILDNPMKSKPGTEWRYSDGDPQIVSEIFKRSTGKTLKDFAVERLFGPLGIVSFNWYADRSQTSYGGWGLSLTPRDLLKIGYLCLKNGEWNGKSVVPAERLAGAVKDRVATPYPGERYAQFWWKPPFGGYAARGYLGQAIFVVPEKDLVVVFTANVDDEIAGKLENDLMADYIIPAIKE